jgi:hypothetical protein
MYNAQVEGTRRSGESSTKIHLRWMDVKTWKTHAVVLNSDTGIGDFRRYVAYVWGVAPAKVILILDGERLVDDNWVLGQRTRTDPILIHALDEPAVPYDW